MRGISATTGDTLGGLDHLRQSIAKILTTPIRTRVMRRDFGSLVPELLDAPINETTFQQLRAAIVHALISWEPRLRVHRVVVGVAQMHEGKLSMDLEGEYWPDGIPDNAQQLRLQGIALQ